MKIFSWVQNKVTGKKPTTNIVPDNHTTPQQPCKEEFSDWPHGLLAIGTFGNKIKQEPEKPNTQQDIHFNHLHGLTPEEVGKLQKEFLIFQEHVEPSPSSADPEAPAEERVCNTGFSDDYRCTSLVHSRGKDVSLDNSKAAIGKKSLPFLLKKMFVCRNGFSPAPISLRDPAMESRMEKMLKTMLHKKIYPQNHGTKLTTKKSLESSANFARTVNGDDKTEKADDGSKWVKTDSEYIVLEI
ncbi:Detected protein of unknown function [Hibiscus syriacus]|uniref:Uncharacterized protein n=1 Tax=Hibiscus syriacus TaxID=106335 RepID=A0A6A2ZDK2_HIBSY|nr:Detected protein of unknown function [Hibiscus syriacus]